MKTKSPLSVKLATTALFLALPIGAWADAYDWEASVDDNFHTSGNWHQNGNNTGNIPGTFDDVYLNVNGSLTTLQITDNQTVGSMRINDGRSVNQSGGTFVISTNAGNGLWVGEYGTGTYTLGGGTLEIDDTTDCLILGKNGGATGNFNLNGGTLSTFAVYGGSGTSNFSFNGGTLQARGANTTFLQGLSSVQVNAGGATVDTNGNDIRIDQSISHGSNNGGGTDGGFTKTGSGVLSLTGYNTWTGATTVNAGTLGVGGGGLYDNGNIAGSIVVNNGGTLRFDKTDTFGNASTTSGVTVTINGGGNVLSNGNFNSIHNVVFNGGTLTADNTASAPYGAFALNGFVTVNGTTASSIVNAGSGTTNFIRVGREGTSELTNFNVIDAAGVLNVGVQLTSNFGAAASGIVKSGAGTLVIPAAMITRA